MKLYTHWMADGIYERRLTAAELRVLMPYLARAVGMTPVGPTRVVFEGKRLWWWLWLKRGPGHPWGLSAWQPLQESHCVLHYMEPPVVCVDVFACRAFDPLVARRILRNEFHIRSISQEHTLERGPELDEVRRG